MKCQLINSNKKLSLIKLNVFKPSLSICWLALLCMFCTKGIAQKQGKELIDSLLPLIQNYKSPCNQPCLKDSNKVNNLIKLGDLYKGLKPDTSQLMTKEAMQLSEAINWQTGIALAYHQRGTFLYGKGDYPEALNNFFKSLAINEKIGNKENKAKNLRSIGLIYNKQGDNSNALKYYNQSLKMMEELNNKEGIGKCYVSIAIVYAGSSDYNNAVIYNKMALKIFEEINYKGGMVAVLSNLGSVYYQKADYSNATDILFRSLKLNEELSGGKGDPVIYNNLASIYRETGDFAHALDYSFKELTINESLKKKNAIASCLLNIGITYHDMGDLTAKQGDTAQTNFNYGKAMEYYNKSLKIGEENDYKLVIANCLGNIGSIYFEQKDYPKTLDYYNRALKLDEELGDQNDIATRIGNIGYLYVKTKNYADAETYLLKAVAITDSIGALNLLKDQEGFLRELYQATGNYDKALEHYIKAQTIKDTLFNQQKHKEITQKEMKYEFEKREAETKAENEKQFVFAEANRRRLIVEADNKSIRAEVDKKLALADADKNIAIAEAGKKMAIVEADNKIAIAEADKKRLVIESEKKVAVTNAELQRQKVIRNAVTGAIGILVLASVLVFMFYKRKRDAVEREKETSFNLTVSETEMKALRAQMNPHFIFNTLHSIQNFLTKNNPDRAEDYLVKFSKLMRLVLENSQHREISLSEDLQALELYMQLESIRLPHPFTYQFHIDKSVNVQSDTIPPLILQPFVENAIWHGLQYKTEPGHISIYINKKDNALIAIVEDNGVGRDLSLKAEQPMMLKKESLGMKLTEERLKILNELKKIKAQFKIIDLFTNENKPAGTRVELSLPLDGN
ncbi:MAG: tetratricopeptide repeat protein [Bacteroidia bacterium]